MPAIMSNPAAKEVDSTAGSERIVRSAAVIPSGLDGRVSVMNASLASKEMHMPGYDDKGAAVGEKTITVDAGAEASFDASDLGKNVFAVAADG